MTHHVDDGQLNALLDGELNAPDARTVDAHLAVCAPCRTRLDDARRFLAGADGLLGLLDPASAAATPPTVSPAPVTAAAVPTEVPADATSEPPRRTSSTAREVAINLDGATQKSPAIRSVFPREQERHGLAAPASASTRRRRWSVRQLAWAASVVMTFGVGYVAGELRLARTRVETAALQSAPQEPAAEALRATPPTTSRLDRPRSVAAATRPTAQRPRPSGLPSPAPASGEGAAAPVGAARDSRALSALAGTGGAARDAGDQLAARPSGLPAPAPAAGMGAPRVGPGAAPVASARSAADMASGQLTAPPPSAAADATPALPAERTARTAAPPLTDFRRISLDTAVARLSGSIRLVDGLTIDHVELGPGRMVSGAAPDIVVVRVVYLDGRGRRIVLDQQRLPAPFEESEGSGRTVNLLYGDTLVVSSAATTRVRWLDRKNFWISVSAALPPDSVRALVDRVR